MEVRGEKTRAERRAQPLPLLCYSSQPSRPSHTLTPDTLTFTPMHPFSQMHTYSLCHTPTQTPHLNSHDMSTHTFTATHVHNHTVINLYSIPIFTPTLRAITLTHTHSIVHSPLCAKSDGLTHTCTHCIPVTDTFTPTALPETPPFQHSTLASSCHSQPSQPPLSLTACVLPHHNDCHANGLYRDYPGMLWGPRNRGP